MRLGMGACKEERVGLTMLNAKKHVVSIIIVKIVSVRASVRAWVLVLQITNLDAIVDNRKKNCFQKSDGAFCGNKIVEVGEECDCGFDDAECQETCCYPRLVLSLL